MKRYDSDDVPLPRISPRAKGGDLIFYGIDPSGPSYQAHVFVNNRDADLDTARDLDHGYVGSFTIFGHGRCIGDEGHCDRWAGPKDEFDFRIPYGVPPVTREVVLSREALDRLTGDTLSVTVVPLSAAPDESDVLRFESWRLATYRP